MERRSGRVTGLVFGGIMAALVVLFALFPILVLFVPIPLVLTYVRYGGRVAGLTSVVAVLFAAMFMGPIQAILLLPGGVLPGLIFGYGLRNGLRPLTIGLIAVAAFFLGYAGEYMVTRVALFEGRDPIAMTAESEVGRAQIERLLQMMEPFTQVPQNATKAQKANAELVKARLEEMRQNPTGVVWAAFPATLFLLGTLSTWINYQLCRLILPRFGHEVPKPTPFGEFRLPMWLTWVFALTSFGVSYGGIQKSLLNAPWWIQVLETVLGPLMLIFVLSGMAVAYGFLRKKDVPKPAAAGLCLVALFLGGLGTQLYTLVAMWDSIFDFRGLGHGLLKRADDTP